MTPLDILIHISGNLPRYTTLFNETLTPDTAVNSGNTITITTVEDHGLTVGDGVGLFNGKVENDITFAEISVDESYITIKTDANHDLTERYQEDVTLENFTNTNLNGDFPLVQVPNRKTIVVENTNGVTGAITLNGNENVVEVRELINEVFEVSQVNSVKEFEIEVNAGLPDNTVLIETLITRTRIALAVDDKRAIEAYTQNSDNKHWLYLITNEEIADKSRFSQRDAINVLANTDGRQSYNFNFNLLALIPATASLTGGEPVQLAHDTIKPALRRTLHNYRFDPTEDEDTVFGAIESGNAPADYGNAYYAHRFDYEVPYDTAIDQGFTIVPSVAHRDTLLQMLYLDAIDTQDTLINHDDEPL